MENKEKDFVWKAYMTNGEPGFVFATDDSAKMREFLQVDDLHMTTMVTLFKKLKQDLKKDNARNLPANSTSTADRLPSDGIGVACQQCGGEVWDNRQNKKYPNGNDYKCKNRDCGWAAWIQKDGSLYWQSPPKSK